MIILMVGVVVTAWRGWPGCGAAADKERRKREARVFNTNERESEFISMLI